MTIGTLDKPLELVQTAAAPAISDRRLSFAYVGPVEWDNMGTITYGLWVHVAPGNDWRFADLRAPGAVHLQLGDDSSALAAFKPPASGRAPYRAVASWGDTAYFLVDLAMLKHMAASPRIGLDVETVTHTVVHFAAAPDAPQMLTRYLHARGY
jgi:hypothetical protein